MACLTSVALILLFENTLPGSRIIQILGERDHLEERCWKLHLSSLCLLLMMTMPEPKAESVHCLLFLTVQSLLSFPHSLQNRNSLKLETLEVADFFLRAPLLSLTLHGGGKQRTRC